MEEFHEQQQYTYDDYASWDAKHRYELIDGRAILQAAPSWEHQGISVELCGQLRDFLKGKSCKVFTAPFDVRLNADKGDDTVVQPDVVVICDRTKLVGTGCIGAPDLIMEILSPATASRDKVLKYNQYLKAGVREYWMVAPESKTVQVCILEDDKYTMSAYGEDATVPVHVLDGCQISLPDVFAEM